MRLHHQPRSRSTRVLWLLEELGIPFDLTVMSREDKQTPEYRALHPLGRSPVLEEDGGPVFESAALILHIADQHLDAGLIGPLGSHERGLQYQWCFFGMTELESALMDIARQVWTDGEPDAGIIERATARFVTGSRRDRGCARRRRLPRRQRVLGRRHRRRLGARLRPHRRAHRASGGRRRLRRPARGTSGTTAGRRRRAPGVAGYRRMRLRPAAIRAMGRAHRAVYRLSGGRLLGRVAGMPVLMLTTTGRRTGRAADDTAHLLRARRRDRDRRLERRRGQPAPLVAQPAGRAARHDRDRRPLRAGRPHGRRPPRSMRSCGP